MDPIALDERIDTLDYLRGFALLGIILVNILGLLTVKTPALHSVDAVYQRFLYLFVEARFYPIFSFLFGVGFYLFISRAYARGENGAILFLRRILVLFIFGFIHFLFQPGEALTVYASCGLLILPFYKIKKELNLSVGCILLLFVSIFAAKVFMPLPLILLGLSAGQYRIFEKMARYKTEAAIFTTFMFILSVGGLLLQYRYIPEAPFNNLSGLEKNSQNMNQLKWFLHLGVATGPFLSAFYAGFLMLLLQVPIARRLLLPLKSYGRMALTNYISQTALILLAGKLFHLFNRITYLQSLWLCLAIYVIQLIFSVMWLNYCKFGPLEWIWRMMTYNKRFPILLKKRQIKKLYS